MLKEYLSRGTYIYPPGPSVRLTTDLITYTVENIPKWNPTNICSYHLQEAGATPTQELAYALSHRDRHPGRGARLRAGPGGALCGRWWDGFPSS